MLQRSSLPHQIACLRKIFQALTHIIRRNHRSPPKTASAGEAHSARTAARRSRFIFASCNCAVSVPFRCHGQTMGHDPESGARMSDESSGWRYRQRAPVFARSEPPQRFICLACGGEKFYLNTKGWEVEATCADCGELEEETILRAMRENRQAPHRGTTPNPDSNQALGNARGEPADVVPKTEGTA